MNTSFNLNSQYYVGVSPSKSKKLCCAINGVPRTCIGLCMDIEERNSRGSRSLCSPYDSVIQECGQNITSTKGINEQTTQKI